MYRFCLLLLVAKSVRVVSSCGYESCTQHEPYMLNVHIVPHTHNEVGWVRTAEDYYNEWVKNILSNVVQQLWADDMRRFTYAETFYFFKWWNEQKKNVRKKVRTLVQKGRLQFAGGGWTTNDEATPNYQSIIDQFTYGLYKLNKTFGPCGVPRVGWQMSPYGHSREFASLLAAMGYEGQFLGRIDRGDKTERAEKRKLEMIWRGDDSLGNSSDIYTGVLYNAYYPPSGFCFDEVQCHDVLIDDGNSNRDNLMEKVRIFITLIEEMAAAYRTNNILVTMGTEFAYHEESHWFESLDKLIKYTNKKAVLDKKKINVFYSTPLCYLKAVKDANVIFPTKEDDFFPISLGAYSYLTGFYTSRPRLKYFIRVANSYLQMAKQLQVVGGLRPSNMLALDELKNALAILQNLHAIAGTALENVADGYMRMLSKAVENTHVIAREAFPSFMRVTGYKGVRKKVTLSFTFCQLNESSCTESENSRQFIVTVYNVLGWSVKEPIKIPVVKKDFDVFESNGKIIASQLVAIPKAILNIPTRVSRATHELVFIANLKPVSYTNFYIRRRQHRPTTKARRRPRHTVNEYKDPEANIEVVDARLLQESILLSKSIERSEKSIEKLWRMLNDPLIITKRMNNHTVLKTKDMEITFNSITGQFFIVCLPDGPSTRLKINYGYYIGVPDNPWDPSGPFKFYPTKDTPENIKIKFKVRPRGPVLKEISFKTNKRITSTVRIYDGLNFIENEWIVGPIDIRDKDGKEYVVNYMSHINNHDDFYTDSNGRQLLKRKLGKHPTVSVPHAGNYYPVTNQIAMEDDNFRLSVITDRSEGGSSRQKGHIELMLYRRFLVKDSRSLNHKLNKTALNGTGLVVRGQHRIIILSKRGKTYKIEEKKLVKQFNLPPQVFVSDAKNISLTDWLVLRNHFSFVNELRKGIHLLTVEPWGDNILIRLENYQEVSDSYFTTMKIDLTFMFTTMEILSVKETTLAANRFIGGMDPWSWYDKNGIKKTNLEYIRFGMNSRNNMNILLKAKQIRTFIADYKFISF